MKLLLDQNLSRHLVRHLRDAFPESRHVTDVGLETSTDREIWSFAFVAGEDEALLVIPALST